MIDKERVIEGLESCSFKQNCSGCPWEGGNTCIDRLHLAALELLKDESSLVLNVEKFNCYHGNCPACGKRIHYKNTNFCPYCGKRVKWE